MMSLSAIHQPHDKFFKLSMGEAQVAQEFFNEHLPSEILSQLNLSTLKLEKNSFIDDSYEESEADVIYSVKQGDATSYLYLLCEHQSTIDSRITFRLWGYMIRLMEAHRMQQPSAPLRFIYPLIVYTGQAAWNAPLDFFTLFGEQESLAREWLLKPFQLLDIHTLEDDELLKRRWCGLVEFALKYKKVRDLKQFLKILLPWVHDIEQTGPNGFSLSKIVLKYVLDGTEAHGYDLFAQGIKDHLSPKFGDEIMTLAQELIQRGRQEALQQGEAIMLTRLLKLRFREIPELYLARIQQADAETLLLWSERILDAKTLEDVFK